MNEFLIDGEIGSWGMSASTVREYLNSITGDVKVTLDSPGGSVFEGISIHNAFKEYDKGTVTMVMGSLVASITTYIAMAGDKILAHDNSTFMIHNAWTFTYGDENELRRIADVLAGLSSLIAKKYISKTGKSKELIKQAMDKESYYFGNEILDSGFCDEIISTENQNTKDESLALARESFKACCKTASEKFSNDEFVQAVAKLTKDGVLDVVPNVDDEEKEVALNNAKQRERDLQILEMEINL
jgi:ATP-dependent protease ClpP protease subunit